MLLPKIFPSAGKLGNERRTFVSGKIIQSDCATVLGPLDLIRIETSCASNLNVIYSSRIRISHADPLKVMLAKSIKY
jgi:hypothetical protein